MLPALWVSKTGLSAQDMNLTTISNNLANVSTTGFKKDRAEFQDLLYQIRRQPGGQPRQDSALPPGPQLGTGLRTTRTPKYASPVRRRSSPPAACKPQSSRWIWPSMDVVSFRYCYPMALFPTPATVASI